MRQMAVRFGSIQKLPWKYPIFNVNWILPGRFFVIAQIHYKAGTKVIIKQQNKPDTVNSPPKS